MIDILAEAAARGARGDKAALVTVIRVAGSAPRRAGAKMLVCADGTLVDTVGGGRVENAAVELAQAIAATQGGPVRWRKHLVRDLGMCCGGEMELLIEPLDAARAAVLRDALRARQARRPAVLRTALTPPWGKQLLATPADPPSRRPRLDDDAFVEAILPPDRLVLFGAGHIAAATAPLAASVGFALAVCDEEESFCSEARFPGATRLHTFEPAEAERALGGFGLADHLLIVTRDHVLDQALLERLLPRTDLGSLGMVGSRGKLGRFRRRLEAKGIGDAAAWIRLRSPVGLRIGAETPEEIALAIVAQLVETRAAAERGQTDADAGEHTCAPSP